MNAIYLDLYVFGAIATMLYLDLWGLYKIAYKGASKRELIAFCWLVVLIGLLWPLFLIAVILGKQLRKHAP